jgi:hypothetical protein
MILVAALSSNKPSVAIAFTEIADLPCRPEPNVAGYLLAANGLRTLDELRIEHSYLRGATLHINSPTVEPQTVTWLNNVFEACDTKIAIWSAGVSPTSPLVRNNLFHNGVIQLWEWGTNTWSLQDNVFFVATTFVGLSGSVDASHNAFGAGITPFGGSARTNLTDDFLPGPLGAYYYPGSGGATSLASLRNAGSRGADVAGLYHFTTSRDQQKETNSLVDIGFHYAATSIFEDGLVGHWKFDETGGTEAGDSSGNGLHGSLDNGPTWNGSGSVAGCLAFDGVDDIVTVSNTAILEVGKDNADFTLAFWINLQQGTSGPWRSVMHKAESGATRTPAIYFYPDTDRLAFRVSITTTESAGFNASAPLILGEWTHVAMVKAGNALRAYIDGALDGQISLASATVHNSGTFYIGDNPWLGGTNGRFDDFRLYSRALDPGEILGLISGFAGDTDGDGLLDIEEDADGDGAADSGESDWLTSNNGITGPAGLIVFTPLR